jgi:hypothetical protein
MRLNKFVLSGLTAVASLGLASEAFADGRNPGSLLLFPEFNNRVADMTLVTVTNTNPDVVNGTVKVEFIYIGKFNKATGIFYTAIRAPSSRRRIT